MRLWLCVLAFAPLFAKDRVEMKGIYLGGKINGFEGQQNWYEVTIKNESSKNALLKIDAVACTPVAIREVKPAEAMVTSGESPTISVPKGGQIQIVYDYRQSCQVEGANRRNPWRSEPLREADPQLRLHMIALLIQGKDLRGIRALMTYQSLEGNELTTTPGMEASVDEKLNGRIRWQLQQGTTAFVNFGLASAVAEVCQEGLFSDYFDAGCMAKVEYVEIPPRSVVLSLMTGMHPVASLYNERNDRVLNSSVFSGARQGVTQTYQADSSITYGPVK